MRCEECQRKINQFYFKAGGIKFCRDCLNQIMDNIQIYKIQLNQNRRSKK